MHNLHQVSYAVVYTSFHILITLAPALAAASKAAVKAQAVLAATAAVRVVVVAAETHSGYFHCNSRATLQ